MTYQPTLETLTKEQFADLVADAEAWRNQPSLRTCLVPGCLRQYDAISCMNGDPAPRPEWSGKGWATLRSGTIFPAGGHICPDHKQLVTNHMPRHVGLPGGRWTVDCACGWMPAPKTWHGLLRTLWEQHLLTAMGKLPEEPPITDPEHRLPLAEHTEASLVELYDRLWDAEADQRETRENARSCILAYSSAVPALLGVKTSLEGLRARITVDSRDWADGKLDALLYAVLVGWNCENTDASHVHNDIDCAGDQGLWNIARQHDIPAGQTIQVGQHRWWVARAIEVAKQIEEGAAK